MEDNLLEAYFKAYLMVLLMFKHAFVCLVFCLATLHIPSAAAHTPRQDETNVLCLFYPHHQPQTQFLPLCAL